MGTSTLMAQSIQDFFIPSGEANKLVFHTPDSQTGEESGMKTIIWFKKTAFENTYEILTAKTTNGNPTSILTMVVEHDDEKVEVSKTISTTMFQTNQEKSFNPPETYLMLPNENEEISWSYTDSNDSRYDCTAVWTEVEFEGQNRRAIKVTRKYIENNSVVDWASTVELYVEGIGLWENKSYTGSPLDVFERKEYDPDPDIGQ